MADKIFESNEFLTKRFSCECLFPGHILDVTIELSNRDKKAVGCTLNLYMDGKAPLRWRLKQVWKLLKGEEGQLADFILRKEDAPEFIELLSRLVFDPYTSSTKGDR